MAELTELQQARVDAKMAEIDHAYGSDIRDLLKEISKTRLKNKGKLTLAPLDAVLERAAKDLARTARHRECRRRWTCRESKPRLGTPPRVDVGRLRRTYTHDAHAPPGEPVD